MECHKRDVEYETSHLSHFSQKWITCPQLHCFHEMQNAMLILSQSLSLSPSVFLSLFLSLRLWLITQPDRTAEQSNQDSDLISIWFRGLDFLSDRVTPNRHQTNRGQPSSASLPLRGTLVRQSAESRTRHGFCEQQRQCNLAEHTRSSKWCHVCQFFPRKRHTFPTRREKINRRQVSIRLFYWLYFFARLKHSVRLFACRTK